MATLLSFGINVNKLEANDKGWANVTIAINDDLDNYGNNVAGWLNQSKEEREEKAPKTYVGNGKVVWTNSAPEVAPKQDAELRSSDQSMSGRTPAVEEATDLPF